MSTTKPAFDRTDSNTNRRAVVRYNDEWEEYVVTFYRDGVKQKKADYFTSDLDDAISTAEFFIKP